MQYDDKILFNATFSVEIRKLFFVGIVTQAILDKSIFKSNDSLHPVIRIFEDQFDVKDKFGNPGFRPYLFASRTLLASRISKLILLEEDTVRLKKIFELFNTYMFGQKNSEQTPTRRNEDSLLQDVQKGLSKKHE